MMLNVRIRDSDLSVGDEFYVIEVEDLDSLQRPKTWKVYRRYQNFVNLRGILQKMYPFCILPPLPTKSRITTSIRRRIRNSVSLPKDSHKLGALTAHLSKTSANRAEEICHGLEAFICYILQHKHIKECEILLAFVCDVTKWLDIPQKSYPVAVNTLSASPCMSMNVHNQSDVVPTYPSVFPTSESSGSMITVSACMANGKLLRSRAKGIQMFWHKFSALAEQLDDTALHAHRQHQRLSNALDDWAPYEKPTALSNSNTILVVANKTRHFANSMDTAKEECVSLMENCLLWYNYAKYSIDEVLSTYQKMQVNLNAKHEQNETKMKSARK